MKTIEEFLRLSNVRTYKSKIKFNGLEFEGDIPEYALGFINGAWFIFNGDHNENQD